jgi:predicted transcriptional regulator
MQVSLNTRLSPELSGALREFAAREKKSIASVVEAALEQYLKEVNPMFELYKEWRKDSEEMIADGIPGSLDCGEEKARQDFSDYADLPEIISFEDMFKLEKQYENK